MKLSEWAKKIGISYRRAWQMFKDTNTFECKICGAKINTPVNGAKNILARRSCKDIKLHYSKKQVLRILVKQYLERVKSVIVLPWRLLRKIYMLTYIRRNPLLLGRGWMRE